MLCQHDRGFTKFVFRESRLARSVPLLVLCAQAQRYAAIVVVRVPRCAGSSAANAFST